VGNRVVAIGVDGEVAAALSEVGVRTFVAVDRDEAVEKLRAFVESESIESVSLLTSGSLGQLSEQWWRTAVPEASHLGVVTCHQVPQMIAAAAVHDSDAPFQTDIANMAGAAAAMRCVAVTQDANGVSWSMPDWSADSAQSLAVAVERIVTHLVRPETEIVTVVLREDASLVATEVEALVMTAARHCEVSVLTCSQTDVTLALGVE
jgi:dihydroxyacetone kinase-like predicted kinase